MTSGVVRIVRTSRQIAGSFNLLTIDCGDNVTRTEASLGGRTIVGDRGHQDTFSIRDAKIFSKLF